ncbi:LOW QUALITY PROTEIN: hypothetical protein HID58_060670 [Brassica napus]|uniref:Uncharacterized protein n=1 Tax=Brassica napus TaxID=3708 RepID=A0ABQ7ZWH5_BRANA|nr:LOW QUALITY PROTEIN: hypothetical protein HID58_060670 [Brassica napus]
MGSGPSMIEQDNDKHNKISEHSGQAMPLEQDEKVDMGRRMSLMLVRSLNYKQMHTGFIMLTLQNTGPAMIEQDNDNHNEIREHSGQAMPLEQDEKVDIGEADEAYVGRSLNHKQLHTVIRVSKLSRSRHDGSPIGRQLVCNKERLHAA